jgi:hypothetical protein
LGAILKCILSGVETKNTKKLLQHQKKLLAVFGKITADKIKTEDVRIFMDRRGLQSKTQANHEMSNVRVSMGL